MGCHDGFEGGLEICVRFRAIELACLNQRCNTPPVTAAFIMACKERVLAIECNRSDAAVVNAVFTFQNSCHGGLGVRSKNICRVKSESAQFEEAAGTVGLGGRLL